ncbi:hypothetical protein [Streptomyces violascens]|uniref:hypothetical protein n=1 Tax=Streptomyces violascens TaxID=67381 RepID=UPI00365DB4FB
MRAYDTDAKAGRTEGVENTMFDTGDVGVFLGLDVGKTAHHGNGLTPAGKRLGSYCASSS